MQDKMSDAVAQGLISAEQVAGSILGERCWVRWPFLQEAHVQAVSDRSHKVTPSHCLLGTQQSCIAKCFLTSIFAPFLGTKVSLWLEIKVINTTLLPAEVFAHNRLHAVTICPASRA